MSRGCWVQVLDGCQKQFFSEAFKVQAFTEVWGSKVLNAFYTEFL